MKVWLCIDKHYKNEDVIVYCVLTNIIKMKIWLCIDKYY